MNWRACALIERQPQNGVREMKRIGKILMMGLIVGSMSLLVQRTDASTGTQLTVEQDPQLVTVPIAPLLLAGIGGYMIVSARSWKGHI